MNVQGEFLELKRTFNTMVKYPVWKNGYLQR